jgi:disulfide bond formation protein DsbB
VKLNGGAVVAAGGLLCLLAVVVRPGNASGALRRVFFIRALIGAVFSAMLVFILLNPYLYPGPLARAGRMLKYRLEDMQWQQAYYAEDKMPEPLFDRVNRIGERVFQDYSSLRFPGAWAVNAALTAAGLALLARSAKNWRRDPSLKNAAGASVLIVGAVVSLPSLFTPLDWDRYYLLPVIFSMICIAAALGRLITVLVMRFRPGWRMADSPA